MAETTGAKRAYHKGNVAEDLVAAARRILKSERVEDLSVRRLAREVGVTPGNFYNHFPSLDHLLLDLAADGFEARKKASARLIKKAENRVDALVATTIDFVEFAIRERQLFRIMFGQVPGGITHERFRQASEAAFGHLVELVYGDSRYDPSNSELSHERSQIGYGMFCLTYGLARNISEKQIEFAPDDRDGIARFVGGVVRSFVDGTVVAEFKDG